MTTGTPVLFPRPTSNLDGHVPIGAPPTVPRWAAGCHAVTSATSTASRYDWSLTSGGTPWEPP